MPREPGNHQLWNERLKLLLLLGLHLVFDSNHGLHAATVHELHNEVDLTLVIEHAVVMHLQSYSRRLTNNGNWLAIMSNSL
jgi:hypothetical protein